MGLQLGGALGNLIDRLTQGYVTDFISVGTFPVFNVADASISIGVAILILGMWIKERRPAPPTPASSEDPIPPASEEIKGG
jgi:signal peptidase II